MRIDWEEALRAYPGQSLGERWEAALAVTTFRELARDLRLPEATLKSCYYRQQHYRGDRCHIVFNHKRTDYAGRMQKAIREFASGLGVTEAWYRQWMQTEEGRAHFLRGCKRIQLPVFCCHYQARKPDARCR